VLAETRLPLLRIDITGRGIPSVVEEIADYLHGTGRIYANY
jgi:hypothetical protein